MVDKPDSDQKQIQCPVCSHMNRAGSLVCENCGTLLDLRTESRRATRDLRDSADDLNKESHEAIQETPEKKVRGSEYHDGLAVHLRVAESKQPIVVSSKMLESDVVLGRRDPITEQVPEVDLDMFAGYRMGVSRRHAILKVVNKMLVVVDLGSSNGTYLNGKRLEARSPEVVMEGDLLRLGQIIMTVQFTEDQQ